MRSHPNEAVRWSPRAAPRRGLWATFALVALSALAVTALAQPRTDRSPTPSLDGREPADPARLTQQERRHVPVLVLPEVVRAERPFDLVVQVGVDPHVMTEAHHIDWVEVTVGEQRAFAADLTAAVGYPIVRLSLVLGEPADLTVRAHCNLHGTWRTRRSIDVR